jgi:hypothetical protein
MYLLGDFGVGYRVTVSGTISYAPGLPGTPGTWTMSGLSVGDQERDWNILSTLWSLPWLSGDVKVLGTVNDQERVYTIGQFNTISGDSKQFEIEFRHLPAGTHNCLLSGIEVKCAFLPVMCPEIIQTSGNIQITIIEEGDE